MRLLLQAGCCYSQQVAATPRRLLLLPYYRPRRAIGGAEVQLYSSFNLGARWGWVVKATTWPLYPGKEIRYPLYKTVMGKLQPAGQTRPPETFYPARDMIPTLTIEKKKN
jgi:hypothetical protein